jgi:hypothetical protein
MDILYVVVLVTVTLVVFAVDISQKRRQFLDGRDRQ